MFTRCQGFDPSPYGYITGIILMGYMPHVDESWDIDGKYPRGSSKVTGGYQSSKLEMTMT
jgi:hypothetical protein